MKTFEKLSDYKRALKTFIRGTIKAKVFVNDGNILPVYIEKEENDAEVKTVTVSVCNGTYCAKFQAEVTTRIFNKFNLALFEPITKQFGKLKNFGGLKVSEVAE